RDLVGGGGRRRTRTARCGAGVGLVLLRTAREGDRRGRAEGDEGGQFPGRAHSGLLCRGRDGAGIQVRCGASGTTSAVRCRNAAVCTATPRSRQSATKSAGASSSVQSPVTRSVGANGCVRNPVILVESNRPCTSWHAAAMTCLVWASSAEMSISPWAG